MDDTDRIIYTKSGKVFFDQDGSGNVYTAYHFATLDDHPALKASDFDIEPFG